LGNRERCCGTNDLTLEGHTMATATWNDTVIAESDETVMVEGNHYFPPSSIKEEFFAPASRTSVCPWKGTASYFDVVVDGKTNADAAWSYAAPKDAAAEIKGHLAFANGVVVSA
jgi:uncharacterized protein (DUF427 family)